MSIVSFLNFENRIHFGSRLHKHYSEYNCNVIKEVHTFDDLRKTKASPMERDFL
jgi:hypothetical protein